MGRTSDAKEKLIQTALTLIWQNSYHAVGVKEICQKAGVKAGSFYYFFPSKQDLALAALESHWNQATKDVLEPAFHPDIPPLQRIQKLFEQVHALHAAHQQEHRTVLGCAFGSFAGELGPGAEDEALRRYIDTVFARIGSYFENALYQAVTNGDTSLTASEVPDVARALVAYYEGMLLLARTSNDAEIIRRLTPHALRLIPTD